jgi:hypothetical protein
VQVLAHDFTRIDPHGEVGGVRHGGSAKGRCHQHPAEHAMHRAISATFLRLGRRDSPQMAIARQAVLPSPRMIQPSYSGGCLCGAVRYTVQGPVLHLCYCHCNSCRRAAGAPMVAWGTITLGQFRLVHGALTEYRSSAPVERGFCGLCGTGITYRHSERAEDIDVALATLDEPQRLAAEAHVWVADKLPWMQISDGLPQHAGGMPPAR